MEMRGDENDKNDDNMLVVQFEGHRETVHPGNEVCFILEKINPGNAFSTDVKTMFLHSLFESS
jgi:hypothetical protein